MKTLRAAAPVAPLALLALAACSSSDTAAPNFNAIPATMVNQSITRYDGNSDDLLTAGLGRTGLAGAAPTVSATPTAAELRRLAIHQNYRAILDITANGGYGTLYGPNVSADGTVTTSEGKIAGVEYIAIADPGAGNELVTMMVQIPASFSTARPCIVTATSSGSRGVYGAIGSAGEWGLKRGCAVAYTDKGTGHGVHDLQNNTVNTVTGLRVDPSTTAGSNFTARLSAAERTAFNTATPNRFAVKHAHSEQNPERTWGRDTLAAIEYAFFAINNEFGEVVEGKRTRSFRPDNTIVIASSVSNGGGAALLAAEQDTQGLIDGIAVTEPNIQIAPFAGITGLPAPGTPPGFTIQRGTLAPYSQGPKPLYDYFSYANLLQPCAALAASATGSPFGFAGAAAALAANRCTALAANGLVAGATTADQAADAMAKLLAYGWEPDTTLLQASHYQFATLGIVVTYSNTYGRFRVTDNLCGYSFGAVDATGAPIAATAAQVNAIFGNGNGVPPAGGWMQLINNNSVGGPRLSGAAISASTGLLDFSFDAALCQRRLWTGTDANAVRVRTGVNETLATGNLRGKPALIVHGRNDTLIPVNFSSRPYFARNQQVEGANSKLRYIEVTNAQHFDAFLGFAGYDSRYVPLHVYFNRAMDAMWNHLTNGTPLPGSQVVRTTPRGGTAGAAPAITAANLPAWSATPPAGSAITFSGSTLAIPD